MAQTEEMRRGIQETAEALGIDPRVLATVISYETAGTFNPTQPGPTTQWGQHRGLIQWGEPQARQYGVDWNDPMGSQLGADGAIVRYMQQAGVEPGMGLLDVYSAVNAGQVGLYNRSDANNGGAAGTVRDKVEQQMGGHMAKAEALFEGAIELGEWDTAGEFRSAGTAEQSPDGIGGIAPPDDGVPNPQGEDDQARMQRQMLEPVKAGAASAPSMRPQARAHSAQPIQSGVNPNLPIFEVYYPM